MRLIIDVFFVTAVIWLLTFLHSRFWRSRYRLELSANATYYTRAEDGWRLALHRYRGPVDGPAVILCHGLGANAFNMDLGRAQPGGHPRRGLRCLVA
jgi:hypothetical protein